LKKPTLALGIAALAAALAVPASAAPRPPTPAAFTDPSGDSQRAADIVRVTATNDAAGTYIFDITVAAPLPPSGELGVYIDADADPTTGDAPEAGVEYDVGEYNASGTGFFGRWNGKTFDTDRTVQVDTKKVSPTEVTIAVKKADIGGTARFGFWAYSWDGIGGTAADFDYAPEIGTWEYRLQVPVDLSVRSTHATAASAGGSWTISLVAGRTDTGKAVGAEGVIACRASSGARALALVQKAFVSSGSGSPPAALCSFAVPKTLKRKPLTGTITVAYGGVAVTHAFAVRVR
jgi:hypothetical protein